MKVKADRPLSKDEEEAIKKHFNDKRVKPGSRYMVNFGGSSVRITFEGEREQKEEEKVEPQQPKRKDNEYVLGEGYRCASFLRDRVPGPQPHFIDDGTNLEHRIRRALYHFRQVGLVGPTGVGKTHLVYKIASDARLPLFEVNCALQTSVYELIGKFIGLGRENWVDGMIVMWLRNGGILYLDEANMMKSDVLSKCHPIMDQRGHIILTEKENEVIKRHPLGYIILSFNPYSIEYAGTKPLNVAFRRRVKAWFHFDYLSKGPKISDFEVKSVMEQTDLADKEIAYKMVKVASELRRLYENGEIPLAPSLGNLVCWAQLVTLDGVTVLGAADETVVDSISDDPSIKAMVRRVINSVFVSADGREVR